MKLLQISMLALAAFLVSCGGSDRKNRFEELEKLLDRDNSTEEKVSEEPQKVSMEDVFSNDYKRKEVLVYEGYIGQVPTTVSMNNGTMSIRIFQRRNQNKGSYVSLDLPLGSGANNVGRLPEKYQQEDLIVTADDKSKLGVGDRVRITANEYYSSSKFYYMDAIKIEKIGGEEFDNSVFATAEELKGDIVHDTSRHEVYGYMDGVLSIPRVFYSYDGDIGLNFKTSTNSDFDKVDIRTGSGASTMDELPASYTEKDLIVRDADGNEIKRGSKVRIYGTWERYSFVSSSGLGGQFKVEEIVAL